MPTNGELRYLIDSYLDWTKVQNIPIVEGVAVDLNTIETAPWPRLGEDCRAAFVHLKARGDFIALQVIDIPIAAKTEQLRHLYDEVFYVLSGHGAVAADFGGGQKQSFEFGPRALFSLPMNVPFRLSNTSSSEPLKIVSANDLPFIMNIYRNPKFLFNNSFQFPERVGKQRYYQGKGDFLEQQPGAHMLETNLVPDLDTLSLPEWHARGAGSRNVNIITADSSMHVHASEIPATAYKKAHRHGSGSHIFIVSGSGYSLMWNRNDPEFERYDWRPGFVFAPPEGMFSQHFNTGNIPARYLAVSVGSHRYPVLDSKLRRKQAPATSLNSGGVQIEYEDQDPRIENTWLNELAKTGKKSDMRK